MFYVFLCAYVVQYPFPTGLPHNGLAASSFHRGLTFDLNLQFRDLNLLQLLLQLFLDFIKFRHRGLIHRFGFR